MINHRQWEVDFDNRLEDAINDPNSTINDLVEIAFIFGILNRIAPEDLEIKKIRMLKRSQVWEGERSDPSLYYRIIYGLEYTILAINNNWSTSFHGYVVAAGTAIMRAIVNRQMEKLFPNLRPEQTDQAIMEFIKLMEQRAMEELEKYGYQAPSQLFQIGSKGKFKGIPVKIDAVGLDGGLILKPDNYHDHCALHELTGRRGNQACPYEMHQGAFIPDKF